MACTAERPSAWNALPFTVDIARKFHELETFVHPALVGAEVDADDVSADTEHGNLLVLNACRDSARSGRGCGGGCIDERHCTSAQIMRRHLLRHHGRDLPCGGQGRGNACSVRGLFASSRTRRSTPMPAGSRRATPASHTPAATMASSPCLSPWSCSSPASSACAAGCERIVGSSRMLEGAVGINWSRAPQERFMSYGWPPRRRWRGWSPASPAAQGISGRS